MKHLICYFFQALCGCRSWSRLRQSSTLRSRSASWPRVTKMPDLCLRSWRKTKNFLFSLTAPIAWLRSSWSRFVQGLIFSLVCFADFTTHLWVLWGQHHWWFSINVMSFNVVENLIKPITLYAKAYIEILMTIIKGYDKVVELLLQDDIALPL